MLGEANRLRVILTVFFEEGFEYFIQELNLTKLLSWRFRLKSLLLRKSQEAPPFVYDPLPSSLRRALERLGPTFIKLGQVLSTRPDFIPEPFICELEKLQGAVPSFPFEEVRSIVETELSGPLEELFLSFEPESLAAASLSQVHRATLKDGSQVAVKVQRPGIRDVVQKDLSILMFLADLLERYFTQVRNYRPGRAIREFSVVTMRELDFTLEAKNVERFRENFRHTPRVRIPAVHWELTSPKVLTLEFIPGVHLDHMDEVRTSSRRELGTVFSRLLMKQVFGHGFFHADLHPGNLLVVGQSIAMLDMGLVGVLEKKTRRIMILFFLAIRSGDIDLAFEYLLEITERMPGADLSTFYDDYRTVTSRGIDKSLAEESLLAMFFEIVSSAARHGVVFPANVVLMSKALLTAEGIMMKLNPHFNFAREALPQLQTMLWEEVNLTDTVQAFLRYLPEFLLNLDQIPDILLGLLRSGPRR